jgi:hypothetical protein
MISLVIRLAVLHVVIVAAIGAVVLPASAGLQLLAGAIP